MRRNRRSPHDAVLVQLRMRTALVSALAVRAGVPPERVAALTGSDVAPVPAAEPGSEATAETDWREVTALARGLLLVRLGRIDAAQATLAARDDCAVSPGVTGETKAEALAHWNRRLDDAR